MTVIKVSRELQLKLREHHQLYSTLKQDKTYGLILDVTN